MSKKQGALARGYSVAESDYFDRIPELRPLRTKRVLIVGLGSIGAPASMELARAGIAHLDLVDADIVDPAGTVRWPFGASAAGSSKAHFLAHQITTDYPYSSAEPHHLQLGRARRDVYAPSDVDMLEERLQQCDLVLDATADSGVNEYLAHMTRAAAKSHLVVEGTAGGWGGHAFFAAGSPNAACLRCYELARLAGRAPKPPQAPEGPAAIQPRGCGDRTFRAAGFDMLQVALCAVRLAVAKLCGGEGSSYPGTSFNLINLSLRQAGGEFSLPVFEGLEIPQDPECSLCRRHRASTG